MVVSYITFVYGIIVDAQFIQKYLKWNCEEDHNGAPHNSECLTDLIDEIIKWNGYPNLLKKIEPLEAYYLPHDDAFEYYTNNMDSNARIAARTAHPNYYIFGIEIFEIIVESGVRGKYPIISEDKFTTAKNKFFAAVRDSPFAEAVLTLQTHQPAIIMVKDDCGCCS